MIDIDLGNFFGTIDHQQLLEILSQRIEDEVFLSYVSRMQKSGERIGDGIKRVEIGL